MLPIPSKHQLRTAATYYINEKHPVELKHLRGYFLAIEYQIPEKEFAYFQHWLRLYKMPSTRTHFKGLLLYNWCLDRTPKTRKICRKNIKKDKLKRPFKF